MPAGNVLIPGPPSHRLGGARPSARAGFTLIEMMAVTAIVGALAAIAIPKVMEAVERAKVARAIGDIRAIQSDLAGLDSLPATLAVIGRGAMTDPWGNPYQYYRFPPGGGAAGARLDRFGIPLNGSYDLFSLGRDGTSSGYGGDDIVRASDGGYIGLASRY